MAIATARVPDCCDEGVEISGEIWSLTCFSFFYITQMDCNIVFLIVAKVHDIVVEFIRIFLEMKA
jgi:hypothetical protein